MSLLIVGERPGRRLGDPLDPTSPTGRRLLDAAALDAWPSHVSLANLWTRSGSIDGETFVHAAEADRLILLGRKVGRAFGHYGSWLAWDEVKIVRDREDAVCRFALLVPHPSGLNRWWNDQANARRGRAALRGAVLS